MTQKKLKVLRSLTILSLLSRSPLLKQAAGAFDGMRAHGISFH
jgi:hypothetical protein